MEEGEISINFRRGCGKIFSKIIPKTLEKPEIGADWRESFKFPKIYDESMEFNGYTHKIIFGKNETKICEDGCYLLLSLQNSIRSQEFYSLNFDYREHPFTILIYSNTNKLEDSSHENIPIINIPLNEYIIGNINTNNYDNIYEYYSIYFNQDSHKIIIDFQSKYVNFYINVGNNRPTIENSDFSSKDIKNQDIIFEITKKEFLNICKSKQLKIPNQNNLKGLSMTIGLYTNKKNILYSNFYFLKVNLPLSDKLDIYEVNSDQKVLCKTTLTKQKENRCLFVILYLGIDSINQLLLYAKIQDNSSYEMFANFIWQEKYEIFDYSYLNSEIPNSESTFSTRKTKSDYIYIEHGEQDKMFLFVSVITEKPTIVELLSSFYTKDIKISPNPGSYQLFGIKNTHFLFEFPIYDDFIINIESIHGEGKIYFEKEVEYNILSGNGDKISLCLNTSNINNKNDKNKNFTNLYIINNSPVNNKLKDIFPGFIFYMNYVLRNNKYNLDEISLGKSTKISYNNTDFPIYIYSLISQFDKDINIFINFYELIEEIDSKFTHEIPFEIKASLINESTIIKYKSNPELLEKINFEFNGMYDNMINIAYILIKKEQIINRNIYYNDNYAIIIKISKNNNYFGITKFNRINLISSIIQENTSISITPNNYQYGKLSLSNNNNIYKLKTDKSKKYMRIYFSSNSLNINYTINTKPEKANNMVFNEYKNEIMHSQSVITFNSEPDKNNYIYLIIYHNKIQSKESEKLNNYAFKYINSEKISNFKIYNLSNSKVQLDVSKNKNNYDYIFSLYPILGYQNLNISYSIKFVFKNDYIKGELNNSIAITESKSYVTNFMSNNIKLENDKIFLKLSLINEIEYRYIQIIAKIKDKNNIEYIGYESIYIQEYESIFIKDTNYGKIIDIIISLITFILIFSLCILVYNYLKKRRYTSSEIEKIPYIDLIGKKIELE